MKIAISLIAFFLVSLFAQKEEIEISAKSFMADEKSLKSIFSGNVLVKRGIDTIKCEILTIYFDKNKKPLRYEAKSGVEINMGFEEKRYFGKSNIAIFDAKNDIYILENNAYINETTGTNRVSGEKIFFDRKSGKIEVLGDGEKPVKLIFTIDEKQ